MIEGCKDDLDKLPPGHDEILSRGMLLEEARLPEDETPDTMERDHDMDSSVLDNDDGEDPHMTK
jgi:hypothetical protein